MTAGQRSMLLTGEERRAARAAAWCLVAALTGGCPGSHPVGDAGAADATAADGARPDTACHTVDGEVLCRCPAGTVADETGRCIAATEQGASCIRALPLDLSVAEVRGSTTGMGDEYRGSCNQPGSEEVVYYFALAELRHLAFEASGFDTTLYLRRGCSTAASEVACNDDAAGVGSRIEEELDPGTYFLFVDGYGNAPGADGGDYLLRVTALCPDGMLADPVSGVCFDDPCDPDPCTAPNQERCQPLAPPEQRCGCNPGYRADGSGACVPDPEAADWTVMMYFNADNDLEVSAYNDLAEMQRVESNDRLHIVMQLDSGYRDRGDARRLYVGAGTAEVIENLGEVDSGDWRTLAEFGVWAIERYPARHHALVMWDHGEGWKLGSRRLRTKGFSFDYSDGGEISVADGDYGQALAAIGAALGRPLDLIGFDACLMGAWEVAAASAPHGKMFVASEESEPYSGWAFDDFLAPLAAAPTMTARHLAELIVDTYADESSDDSTMSAIDLSTLDELATALSALADAMRGHPDRFAAIEVVRRQTQNVEDDGTTRDLGDFAARIAVAEDVPAVIVQTARALTAQLDRCIVHNRVQAGYGGFTGLTIYFPARGSAVDPDYLGAGAIWSQRTTWDEFLDAFTR
ncbi:MAG: hypothetical protein JXR83_14860 [Deltaproteobacteria bacterium]|nr:hypothetical protein [Deltaproteobacteria bacterium]